MTKTQIPTTAQTNNAALTMLSARSNFARNDPCAVQFDRQTRRRRPPHWDVITGPASFHHLNPQLKRPRVLTTTTALYTVPSSCVSAAALWIARIVRAESQLLSLASGVCKTGTFSQIQWKGHEMGAVLSVSANVREPTPTHPC